MHLLVVVAVLLAACGKDPLRDDMKMFCRAVDVVTFDRHVPKTGPGHITLVELGPWMETRAKTPELKALLDKLEMGTTTLDELLSGIDALVKQANIDSCPTLSWARKPQDP